MNALLSKSLQPADLRKIMEACPVTTWDFDGNTPFDFALSPPDGIFSILSENFTQVGILAMPTEANLKAAIYWPNGVLSYASPRAEEFVKIHFRLTEIVSLSRQSGGALTFHNVSAEAECLLLFGEVEHIECATPDGELFGFRPNHALREQSFLRPPLPEVIRQN